VARALARHWPEYLMEALGLGLYMLLACVLMVAVEHPASPVRGAVGSPLLRRAVIGMAMGLTAVGLIYSPWGQRSGAHLNPSVTLTFWRLGKVAAWDGVFYILAQFAGGLAGVLVAASVLRQWLADPVVNYAVTRPGLLGSGVAFVAELLISLGFMTAVLFMSNAARLAPLTGLAAGALVATYITIEAPLSGMSMNPARTFASAVPAAFWMALWVYFTAPVLGMLLAAEGYLHVKGAGAVACAKLHHRNSYRCIFRCGYQGSRPCATLIASTSS
jgi:aquaporin Z